MIPEGYKSELPFLLGIYFYTRVFSIAIRKFNSTSCAFFKNLFPGCG